MAYGNNRAGGQPRSHFRQAGGAIIKFRHPYFAGMIDTASGKAIDEIVRENLIGLVTEYRVNYIKVYDTKQN